MLIGPMKGNRLAIRPITNQILAFVVLSIVRPIMSLTKLKLNSVALVRERTIPTELPPLVGEVVPTFADRRCRVVSAADSHGR
jgi:hypothetical protein